MTLSNLLCAAWAVDFMAVPQVMECVPSASKMPYGENNLHQPPVQLQWCQAHQQVGSVRTENTFF